MTEDEMVGWHRRLDRREFEWTPGVGGGLGGLACCGPWGRRESDTTERLNSTDTYFSLCICIHTHTYCSLVRRREPGVQADAGRGWEGPDEPRSPSVQDLALLLTMPSALHSPWQRASSRSCPAPRRGHRPLALAGGRRRCPGSLAGVTVPPQGSGPRPGVTAPPSGGGAQ